MPSLQLTSERIALTYTGLIVKEAIKATMAHTTEPNQQLKLTQLPLLQASPVTALEAQKLTLCRTSN